MKSWRAMTLGTLMLLAAACAAPGPSTQVDIAAEEEAIRTISADWLDMVRSRDAAGIAGFFASDGVMVRENLDPIVGPDAIRDLIARDFDANPNLTPDFSPDQIEVSASGDMAVEYGRWHDTNLGADGSGEDSGRYMTLYQKIDGVWRAIVDFSMSTAPEEG